MPTEWNENLWRALYAQGGYGPDGGTVITYGAEWVAMSGYADMFIQRKDALTNLGIQPGVPVLIVGSAYGYGMSALVDAGFDDVWGIDPSPWIWSAENDAEWAPGMKLRTAQDWMGSGSEMASLEAIGFTGQFQWVVDEDAASSHLDHELERFMTQCEDCLTVDGQVIHIVTPLRQLPGDSAISWKSMEDWRAFAPDHQWVDTAQLNKYANTDTEALEG